MRPDSWETGSVNILEDAEGGGRRTRAHRRRGARIAAGSAVSAVSAQRAEGPVLTASALELLDGASNSGSARGEGSICSSRVSQCDKIEPSTVLPSAVAVDAKDSSAEAQREVEAPLPSLNPAALKRQQAIDRVYARRFKLRPPPDPAAKQTIMTATYSRCMQMMMRNNDSKKYYYDHRGETLYANGVRGLLYRI
eukprot:TRINITY_DN16805_c0_g1_i1.p2 TRINITY_DN16805_c0_g1~~TRINITY_DN16805_c0_g1_i1.p2  ORF type:complete len:195 (+),score=42.05 TRINITY_DN16805_c0_g1_i1:52-636(+)